MTKNVGRLAFSPRKYSCQSRRLATSAPARLSVEKPWQGGPPMTTSASGKASTCWIGRLYEVAAGKLAAYVAAARGSDSTAKIGSKRPAVDEPAAHRAAAREQVDQTI